MKEIISKKYSKALRYNQLSFLLDYNRRFLHLASNESFLDGGPS